MSNNLNLPKGCTVDDLRGSARRNFLKSAALVIAPAAMFSATSILSAQDASTQSAPEAASADTPGAYLAAKTAFRTIQNHENAHVSFLLSALGSEARPRPTFQNLETTSFAQFVTLARTFENTGTKAYLGALPFINNQTYIGASGSIAQIEARHASYLNVYTGHNISVNNNAFEVEYTYQQVVSGVTPFIADLNGGDPPMYEQTRSDMNDTDILNFALLLEFLEAKFYNINVPKYFGAQ